MPSVPPRVAALAGMLAAATGTEPLVLETPGAFRVLASLPSPLSNAIHSTILMTLAHGDRFGHDMGADGIARVWAEIDHVTPRRRNTDMADPAAGTAPGDAEYRTLIAHTAECAACRSDRAECEIAERLSRAWRAARQ
ncbi:hypothetical protein [Streptomyces sp. NBC_00102]|uniref:hypothetical protein n=1 Tax=Streptomyces sp. NBC_00102 TaxID=2975652 RepID=UPI00224D81C8|nr:hypothetical protein [Streptomyces sp. NBC_00102]MCX5398054.1 hypothetical protein [Streptomyces sp. NBC_00102]